MKLSICNVIACLFLAISASASAIDYKTEVLPIMKAHCWDCHAGGNAKGSLNLEDLDEMRDYQVGKFNIIRPGNSAESSFLEKMHLPTSSRDFMPRKGEKLPDEELAIIAKWIDAGAIIDKENPAEKEMEWVKKAGGRPAAGGGPSRDFLTWESSDGRAIEARFMGLQGESVRLMMKRDGKAYTVPLARLAPESAALARKMGAQ